MPSINKILENIDVFLGGKLESDEERHRLISELSSIITDLIKHPHLPIRKRLLALFKRFEIDEAIASSLVTSLKVGIEKERSDDFELHTEEIDRLSFPLLEENAQLILEKTLASLPDLEAFPQSEILEVVEEAAIPFAQLLGSNVAEALALQSPAGLIKGKFLAFRILQGDKVDPYQLVNLFQGLSSEQRLKLSDLVATQVTQAQQTYKKRKEDQLRVGRISQWVYDKLREINVPHQSAEYLAPKIAKSYKIEELDQMNDKQFRKLISDLISSEYM